MNDALRALILGVVEGLTEFLPISSTGHMVLVNPLLGIPEGSFWTKTFIIFIQIGAILAVTLYFWKRLWRLTLDRETAWRDHFVLKLFIAFLPAAVLGLLFDDIIESYLMRPVVVALALIVGGVLIILIERRQMSARITDAATVSLIGAFTIGLAQCLAMIPGTSRSAATIMGALLIGMTPAAAAEFSFFLAIPTLFAAGGYSLLKNLDDIQPDQYALLAIGFVTAFVVAWLVVAGFMRFIQTHKFTSFAIYRMILGAAVLIYLGV